LLCEGQEVDVVDRFSPDALRKGWAVFGVQFAESTWKAIDRLGGAELFRCAACGFEFCRPVLAGDGDFYAQLEQQKQKYYPPDVPEFIRTLGWAQERHWHTVLDIGCGEGAFLDSARAAGLKGTGVELNLLAAEACRKKGHEVHTRLLSELLDGPLASKFDLVTVFQVLEHVSDPVGFLKHASQFLAPGGCVSVAVPNDRGIYRICPKEPHQWPPHHVTRWRLEDLRRIADRCNLRLICAGANRLHGLEAQHFWQLHNQLAAAIGDKPLPGGTLLPKGLSLLYRLLGLRFIVQGMGTSIYALYQRPRA
jgi:SAM-dependent methyltransferase